MMQAAAKLYLFTNEVGYLEQATQAWQWFTTVPLRDAVGLLGDGLTGTYAAQSDCCNGTAEMPSKPRCLRTSKPSYTYNQGLFVGSARLMYRISGNHSFVLEAQ